MKETALGTMNRRTLLGGGAALVGGAFAGFTPIVESALAQKKTAAAGADDSVNYAPPEVTIDAGKVRGLQDGKTTVFLGIPYADAERFELPKPVKPWDGVKNTQVWGPVCPIATPTKPGFDELVFPHRFWVQNEHCQVLNVWTQNASTATKKPVMVWMHGGGFSDGSSMESYGYDGKNLSEYGDVVVVSMNHRLNIIGTLDLSAYGPQYAQSRYTGTMDLLLALQWVNKNIAQFGGDPGNVTIFGQSGGGGKVARMMHMPAAKGLFHKAITQSGGTDMMREINVDRAIKREQAVAAATLANLKLTGDQIDQLKKVPYPELLAAGQAAQKQVSAAQNWSNLNWEVVPDNQFITLELCDWANAIPQINGSVFSEHVGTLDKGTGKNDWTPAEVDEHLTKALGEKKDEVVAAFKQNFPRKKPQDVLYFAAPAQGAMLVKLEKATAPLYNYMFAYEYPVDGGITSFHTSEIAFVFHNLKEPQMRVASGGTQAGLALQDKVAMAWINFAKTGNPGADWKPFTATDKQAMVFDVVSECRAMNYDPLVPYVGKQNLIRT
jgi:para-nitrobenzyl esterase